MTDETTKSNEVAKTKKPSTLSICLALSILSIVGQVVAYKMLWPPSSAMNGPMGMLAYQLQSYVALIAVAGISIGVFVGMLLAKVKWYVGQGLALVNFLVAAFIAAI